MDLLTLVFCVLLIAFISHLLSQPFGLPPNVFNYYVKLWSIPSTPSWTKIRMVENCFKLFFLKRKYRVDTADALFRLLLKFWSESQEILETGVTKFWFGPFVVTMITRPEPAEALLRKSNLPKSYIYTAFDSEVGNGLITSSGSIWKNHRRLLTPSFDVKIIEGSMAIMKRHVDRLLERLGHHADEERLLEHPFSLISYCTFDILTETGMGLNSNCDREGFAQAIKAFTDTLDIITRRITHPYYLWKPLFWSVPCGKKMRHLLDHIFFPFVEQLMNERKVILENDLENGFKGRKKNFLDLLLLANMDSPNDLPKGDIMAEMLTFLTAGFETVTTTITWALLMLGHHPDVQNKMAEEMNFILGPGKDIESLDELKNLKYLDAVTKECLRLQPPGPTFARDMDEDTEVPLGKTGKKCTIPKGATIIFVNYLIHRCADHWPDPQAFNPDRFLTNERRHPYSYVPFSAGPRNCIAQRFALNEVKYILGSIFRNFKLETQINLEDIKASPRITYRPIEASPIRIMRRERIQEDE